MRVTLGTGNNRQSTEILAGRFRAKSVKRIEVERNSEHIKNFVCRPKLMS